MHLRTWSRAALISTYFTMAVSAAISAIRKSAVIRACLHGTAFAAATNLFTRHGSAPIADIVTATVHRAIAAILHAFTKLLHAFAQALTLGGSERSALTRPVRAALSIRARGSFARIGITGSPIIHLTIWAIVAIRASSPTVVHAAITRLLIGIARGLEALIGALVRWLANGDGGAGGVIIIRCGLSQRGRLQPGKESRRGNQASRMG